VLKAVTIAKVPIARMDITFVMRCSFELKMLFVERDRGPATCQRFVASCQEGLRE
jgi:hypothetical protein